MFDSIRPKIILFSYQRTSVINQLNRYIFLGQVNAEIRDKSSELINRTGLEPAFLGEWIQVKLLYIF